MNNIIICNLIVVNRRSWYCIWIWCCWALLVSCPHRLVWMPCWIDNKARPNNDYRRWSRTNGRRHFSHQIYPHRRRRLCRESLVCCHWKENMNEKSCIIIGDTIFTDMRNYDIQLTLESVECHRICQKYRTFRRRWFCMADCGCKGFGSLLVEDESARRNKSYWLVYCIHLRCSKSEMKILHSILFTSIHTYIVSLLHCQSHCECGMCKFVP